MCYITPPTSKCFPGGRRGNWIHCAVVIVSEGIFTFFVPWRKHSLYTFEDYVKLEHLESSSVLHGSIHIGICEQLQKCDKTEFSCYSCKGLQFIYCSSNLAKFNIIITSFQSAIAIISANSIFFSSIICDLCNISNHKFEIDRA
jgi:hypothetical protein